MTRLNEPSSPRTADRDRRVFISCLPRVGSTWLSYKFADRPGIAFRFEPFHENLIAGTHPGLHEAFARLRFGASLRHPPRDRHYHQDYDFQPGGGVALFQKRFCYQNYCIAPDSRDEALQAYLATLIEQARRDGPRLCVKCTRSSLRVAWLKRHFGGTHVYLFRNPRLIDNSHFSFRGYSNPYVRDYALITGQNRRHPLFAELARWGGLDEFDAPTLGEEQAHYHRGLLRGYPSPYDRQYHFDVLYFFWAVALASASRSADLIIDADALANGDVRDRVAAEIRARAGVTVDLSDYRLDAGRVRRILARHRMRVSDDMAALIRNALSGLRPDWDRALGFALTGATQKAIQFFD